MQERWSATSDQRKLLPPPREQDTTVGLVTSDNFLNFLVGGTYFPHKKWEFAPQLDLSWMTSTLNQLQNSTNDVYVYPEEARQFWTDFLNKPGKPPVESPFDKKGPGERSTLVYLNLDNQMIEATDILQGEHGRVQVGILLDEVAEKDNLPLMLIHTHPTPSLPSQIDYLPILEEAYKNGRSLTRGIMVVCPGIQILALPTDQTPFEPTENAIRTTQEANDEHEKTVNPWIDKRIERFARLHGKIGESMISAFSKITQKKNEGKLSEEEANEQYKTIGEYLLYIQDGIASRINAGFRKRINFLDNFLLIDFARKTNMQIYTSTDMQHFVKASA